MTAHERLRQLHALMPWPVWQYMTADETLRNALPQLANLAEAAATVLDNAGIPHMPGRYDDLAEALHDLEHALNP